MGQCAATSPVVARPYESDRPKRPPGRYATATPASTEPTTRPEQQTQRRLRPRGRGLEDNGRDRDDRPAATIATSRFWLLRHLRARPPTAHA